MSYITNADIQARLGAATYVQLTDDDDDGQADAAVVDEARLGAEGEMNSYLARQYLVPVDTSANAELAGLLATVALDLVELRLRARRPPVPADVLRKHEQALKWLKAVAEGGVALPSAASLPAGEARGFRAATRGALRFLTRDELADH